MSSIFGPKKPIKMVINKPKLQDVLAFQKRIAHLLYPVIFSLLSVLSANGQETKNNKANTNQKITTPKEVITDSVFLDNFEKIFNQLTNADLTESSRNQFEQNITLGLDIYFNESEDPLTAIKPDQMYVKRKREAMPQKLEQFLKTFYKEDYRSSGKLSIKVLSVSKDNNKIYIEYDYVYTPTIEAKPKL